MKPLVLTPLEGLPLIKQGDDLAQLTLDALSRQQIALSKGDIIVLAQKIISKAEGRRVHLSKVKPSKEAKDLAAATEKDPRLAQLILDESNAVLRSRPGLLVVEHRLGLVCANAGIDHSNVDSEDKDWVLLLPQNPDASAQALRQKFEAASGARLGVLIIDSHGRA